MSLWTKVFVPFLTGVDRKGLSSFHRILLHWHPCLCDWRLVISMKKSQICRWCMNSCPNRFNRPKLLISEEIKECWAPSSKRMLTLVLMFPAIMGSFKVGGNWLRCGTRWSGYEKPCHICWRIRWLSSTQFFMWWFQRWSFTVAQCGIMVPTVLASELLRHLVVSQDNLKPLLVICHKFTWV